MTSAVGLVSYSTSKLVDHHGPKGRISQSSVSNRLQQQACIVSARPSLPDLLAAEGLEANPELKGGYVQKIRQQYLQLIANSSASSLECSTTVTSSVVKSHAPPPPVSSQFRNNFPRPKQDATPLCHTKPHPQNAVSHSAPHVQSLRARFDAQKSAENSVRNSISPLPQQTRQPSPTPVQIPTSKPPAPKPPVLMHQNSLVEPQNPVASVVKGPAPKPPPAAPVPVLPVAQKQPPQNGENLQEKSSKKQQQPQVFGERIVIFKSRALQNVQLQQQPKVEQQTPDLILSSSSSKQPQQDWVDFGSGPNDFKLPETMSFSDDEDQQDEKTAKEEPFRFKIIGAAAPISSRPMWKSQTGSSKQIRFDDKIAIFGYEESEEELEVALTNVKPCTKLNQTMVSANHHPEVQLGMRPIEALTAGSNFDDKKMETVPSLISSNLPMDMVF